jgi:uncharacterized membrane protein YidH (DUF202 family)/predicted RNA-binding Zn-ribbon protein involved in translation (DUF1610 family)
MQATTGTRNCVSCGRAVAWDANVCPYCGHDYRAQMMPAQQTVARTGHAGWGGGLIIASGVLGLIMGILLLFASSLNYNQLDVNLPSGFTNQDLKNLLAVLGAAFAVFGVIAIIGGVFAAERKHFAMAVVGAIFGIISIGFFLGAVLAVIGLILVVMSRHEFRQAPGPP